MLYGIDDQPVGAGAAIPSGPYAPHGVHFTGLDGPGSYLDCASLSATDNGSFSFSWWIKGLDEVDNDTARLYSSDPNNNEYVYCLLKQLSSIPGHIYMEFNDSGFAHSYWATFGPFGAGWHHFLGTAEMNHAAGAKLLTVYVDDVHQTLFSVSDASASFIPVINGMEFAFADSDGGRGYIGDFCDAWIAPGISLIDETGGTISEATRRLFTDFTTADGCSPIDPTTFPSSAILFSGDASGFVINQGTGGAFSQVGSITDASTDPP